MGQALRRATSRVGSGTSSSSKLDSSSSHLNNIQKPPPPPPPQHQPKVQLKPNPITQTGADDSTPDQDDISRANPDNVLEEKDTGYDAMLSQMVGRIKTKPGGKLEMGEAFIVEKYDRPMPKLRHTKPESNYDEEKQAAPGTLKVTQLKEILLLHQGKASDKSMDVHQIAKQYRVDVGQVEKILQFVSLPAEDSNNKQKDK